MTTMRFRRRSPLDTMILQSQTDETRRRLVYGKLRPMDRPSLLRRLLGLT